MWSGAIVDIPFGWKLCDGTFGTPDLTGRMIRCPESGKPPHWTGGSPNHNHASTAATHTHTIPAGTGLAAGNDFGLITDPTAPGGTTGYDTFYPRYYVLAFIMHI